MKLVEVSVLQVLVDRAARDQRSVQVSGAHSVAGGGRDEWSGSVRSQRIGFDCGSDEELAAGCVDKERVVRKRELQEIRGVSMGGVVSRGIFIPWGGGRRNGTKGNRRGGWCAGRRWRTHGAAVL
jgi:hypothetical protein